MPWVLSLSAEHSALELARGNDNVPLQDRLLNKYERLTIIALLAHKAYQRGLPDDRGIAAALCQHFDINQPTELRAAQFNAAVAWLCG